MTNLTRLPLLLALMQMAVTVPSFFVAEGSDGLVDVVNRQQTLIVTQLSSAVIAKVIAIVAMLSAFAICSTPMQANHFASIRASVLSLKLRPLSSVE